jgi:hypothetical protein
VGVGLALNVELFTIQLMLLLLTAFGVTGLLFALTTYDITVWQLLPVFVTVKLYVPASVAETTDVFAGPLIPGPLHV